MTDGVGPESGGENSNPGSSRPHPSLATEVVTCPTLGTPRKEAGTSARRSKAMKAFEELFAAFG